MCSRDPVPGCRTPRPLTVTLLGAGFTILLLASKSRDGSHQSFVRGPAGLWPCSKEAVSSQNPAIAQTAVSLAACLKVLPCRLNSVQPSTRGKQILRIPLPKGQVLPNGQPHCPVRSAVSLEPARLRKCQRPFWPSLRRRRGCLGAADPAPFGPSSPGESPHPSCSLQSPLPFAPAPRGHLLLGMSRPATADQTQPVAQPAPPPHCTFLSRVPASPWKVGAPCPALHPHGLFAEKHKKITGAIRQIPRSR